MKMTNEMNYLMIQGLDSRVKRIEKILLYLAFILSAKMGADIMPFVSALLWR